MHRIKRPLPEAKSFSSSQVHYRTSHDLPGEEPKAKTMKQDGGTNFQLNAMGGPLEEEFEDKT